jgi:hypothetical protein
MSTITVDQFGLAKQNNAEFKLQTPKEQKIEISKDEAGGLSKGEQRKQVTTTDDKVKKLEKTLAVGVATPIASIFSKMKEELSSGLWNCLKCRLASLGFEIVDRLNVLPWFGF